MKNMQPTSRKLRIIEQGQLAGSIFSDNPFGAYDELPLSQFYTAFLGTIYEAPAPFTRPVLSVDTRQIYVSPTGDDNNDGTYAAPVRTLTKAISLQRVGFPDHILLDCTGRWREPLMTLDGGFKSGRSETEPAVLGWYNPQPDGRRPVIEGQTIANDYNQAGKQNVWWLGIEFYNPFADPLNPDFAPNFNDDLVQGYGNGFTACAQVDFNGFAHNILVEDCKFDIIEFQATPNKFGQYAGKMTLRRNIFLKGYVSTSSYRTTRRPSNVYLTGVGRDYDFVMEDNVFDYGGWHPTVDGAATNSRNHCAYLTAGNGNRMFVRRNIISRGSSHGFHQRSGGIQENNLAMRCSVGLQVGYNQAPLQDGWIAYSRRNVVIEGASQFRGGGSLGADINEVSSGAVWGIVTGSTQADNGFGADFRLEENLIARTAQGTAFKNTGVTRSNNFFPISTTPGVFKAGNITEYWNASATFPPVPTSSYPDPKRGLATYYSLIMDDPALEADGYDMCMNLMTNRGLCQSSSLLETIAINAYIRAGFGMN